MAFDLTRTGFWGRPLLDEIDSFTFSAMNPGVSIWEDEKNVYVDIAVPGLTPEDIEITFDKGVLWIKGEEKEEEEGKNKKYYARSRRTVNVRVSVPGELDTSKEPTADYNNGILQVTFAKVPQTQPKKIQVKTSTKK